MKINSRLNFEEIKALAFKDAQRTIALHKPFAVDGVETSVVKLPIPYFDPTPSEAAASLLSSGIRLTIEEIIGNLCLKYKYKNIQLEEQIIDSAIDEFVKLLDGTSEFHPVLKNNPGSFLIFMFSINKNGIAVHILHQKIDKISNKVTDVSVKRELK